MFFRTDMAVERRDLYRNANKIEDEINGIECEEEKKENITITRVKIKDKEGEKALNKKGKLYNNRCEKNTQYINRNRRKYNRYRYKRIKSDNRYAYKT